MMTSNKRQWWIAKCNIEQLQGGNNSPMQHGVMKSNNKVKWTITRWQWGAQENSKATMLNKSKYKTYDISKQCKMTPKNKNKNQATLWAQEG